MKSNDYKMFIADKPGWRFSNFTLPLFIKKNDERLLIKAVHTMSSMQTVKKGQYIVELFEEDLHYEIASGH